MDPDEDPYAIVILYTEIAVISSPALTVMSDGVRDMIVGAESTPDSQNSSSLVTRGSSQVDVKIKNGIEFDIKLKVSYCPEIEGEQCDILFEETYVDFYNIN